MTRILVLLLALTLPASAHDSWISRGGLKNGAGEWCCGEGDCALMDPGAVQAKPYGYVIYGHGTIGEGPGAIRTELIDEIVPYSTRRSQVTGRASTLLAVQAPGRSKRADASSRPRREAGHLDYAVDGLIDHVAHAPRLLFRQNDDCLISTVMDAQMHVPLVVNANIDFGLGFVGPVQRERCDINRVDHHSSLQMIAY
jgi:hypothetical protein